METILKISCLEKSYKDRRALKGISVEVKQGEILCFLGPNGAGKSTTINILATALKADGGEINFLGRKILGNDKEFKRNLGIVPQNIAIYEEVSAENNVKFFASLYGLKGKELEKKTEEALEFVGLTDRKKDKPKTFSGGMKRRLNIACAIAHNPKIIIMDEPTVGIDSQSRNHILDSIRKLKKKGATIIYTTHYMEEVEEISTRIVIIDHGEVIAEGSKEELKESFAQEKIYKLQLENPEKLVKQELFGIEGIKKVELKDNLLEVNAIKGIENLDKIISTIMKYDVKITNVTSIAPSLETVFLKLTGRSLRD
ncbi:ABC transporter ATP-binding protein [Clostridium sp. 19966]|uniref:ABC transporter ATP-binding protein n=1 Tax=Clostridium sp. 19966 TaxID=2768166 RepID=UPI0028DFAC0F|nr:ABC transporter ATP-binding protein [Clostridium sp. 19966]MDT8718953.1 ABC transporter ATP-binding protein [Clostridium sp. 19966]